MPNSIITLPSPIKETDLIIGHKYYMTDEFSSSEDGTREYLSEEDWNKLDSINLEGLGKIYSQVIGEILSGFSLLIKWSSNEKGECYPEIIKDTAEELLHELGGHDADSIEIDNQHIEEIDDLLIVAKNKLSESIYEFNNLFIDEDNNIEQQYGYENSHIKVKELHDIILLKLEDEEILSIFDGSDESKDMISQDIKLLLADFIGDYIKNYSNYFGEQYDKDVSSILHLPIDYVFEIGDLLVDAINFLKEKKLGIKSAEEKVNIPNNMLSANDLYIQIEDYFNKYLTISNSTGNNSDERFTIKENLDNSISTLAGCSDEEIYQLINDKDFNLQRLLEMILHDDIQNFDFAAKIQKIISTSSAQ